MINHIQNKNNVLMCLHNICMSTVYMYYVHINTHKYMCIFQKICYVYKLNIFIYNIKYMNINIDM